MGDGWTTAKVKEQTDIELDRLEEDSQRAHKTYDGEPKGITADMTERTGSAANKSETFIPETEGERHDL